MTSSSESSSPVAASARRLSGHPGPCDSSLHAYELEGVDELTARVFRAYRRSLRLHRQLMAKTMAEHGSHPGQAVCLRLLSSNDGITQRDLAEALHVGRATVSKMLRGMEQARLIERRPDDRDQRLVRVFLTASGRERAADLRGVEAAQINATVSGLPIRDQEELARLLEALSDSIERVLDERRGSAGESPTGDVE
jgi:DNA-binding MarR family transcriptional regulator